MFEQILTYFGGANDSDICGVLNFKVENISCFHVPEGSSIASLMVKGADGFFYVKYDDLKKIIDKTQSNKD